MSTQRHILYLGGMLVFMVCLGWVGSQDFITERKEMEHAHEMYCEGLWPDIYDQQPRCE